jgi:hypothetical protein
MVGFGPARNGGWKLLTNIEGRSSHPRHGRKNSGSRRFLSRNPGCTLVCCLIHKPPWYCRSNRDNRPRRSVPAAAPPWCCFIQSLTRDPASRLELSGASAESAPWGSNSLWLGAVNLDRGWRASEFFGIVPAGVTTEPGFEPVPSDWFRLQRPGGDGSTMVLEAPPGAGCISGGVPPCGLVAGAPPEPVEFGPVHPWG